MPGASVPRRSRRVFTAIDGRKKGLLSVMVLFVMLVLLLVCFSCYRLLLLPFLLLLLLLLLLLPLLVVVVTFDRRIFQTREPRFQPVLRTLCYCTIFFSLFEVKINKICNNRCSKGNENIVESSFLFSYNFKKSFFIRIR